MNELLYWYYQQTIEDRAKFRSHMAKLCGVDERTIYRYLSTVHAPKLTAHMLSDYTKIPTDKLYSLIKIQTP